MAIDQVNEKARMTPVLARADVVVAGGGPSGIAAALASSRAGAKTLLIERYGYLGGIPLGNPTWIDCGIDAGIIKGIAREFGEDFKRRGSPRATIHSPEWLKDAAFEKLGEAGVKVVLHSFVADAIMEGDVIKGVLIESKSGRQAILGRVIIDATGDADVAVRAGAAFKIEEKDGELQPLTLLFALGGVDFDRLQQHLKDHPEEISQLFAYSTEVPRFAEEGAGMTFHGPALDDAMAKGLLHLAFDRMWVFQLPGMDGRTAYCNAGNLWNVDPTDVEDLTRAEIEGRRQANSVVQFLRRRVPGFETCYIAYTAPPYAGARESRRVLGEYVLTQDDVVQARKFDDGIARSNWAPDIHSRGKQKYVEGVIRKDLRNPALYYEVPYRSLVPRGIDNLLVAGKTISCDHVAQGTIRTILVCLQTGQAAGVAAALSVQRNTTPRALEASALIGALQDQNAL